MSVYSAHSDQELLLLIGENSERAMTEIFDRYWDKLLAVALNRLDNLEEAEECVQDVFLKLWKLRETLELKYTLYTYLSAAVRYRVLDLLDKQYRKLQYAPEMLSEMQNEPPSSLSSDGHLLEKDYLILAILTARLS
jgi:RNA polymerase sigma factor (sigma-70 family)